MLSLDFTRVRPGSPQAYRLSRVGVAGVN